ncbi:MAG: DUF1236 domain-containing protein [Bradyrhizobiaceae bacterium]|nr:DUF1236 domain-containing protein [Bradyrhizobiaceae bacterium]
MQDQRPRAQEQQGTREQRRAQDRQDLQDQRPRAQERERTTTEQRQPRGQERAVSPQRHEPRAQQRREPSTGEATERTRPREETGRAETRSRTSGDVQLSSRQETTIQQTFQRERNVNIIRDRDINFSINIGAAVPRSVRLAPLPAAIVAVVPQFRGYRYVVVEEEIVIVHPQTYAVVAVLPYGGPARASVRSGTRVQLSAPQRARILSFARAECDAVIAQPDFPIALGAQIPQWIELCPFEEVVEEVDVVRPYRFFVVQDQVVLVDPSDYRIVEVIR